MGTKQGKQKIAERKAVEVAEAAKRALQPENVARVALAATRAVEEAHEHLTDLRALARAADDAAEEDQGCLLLLLREHAETAAAQIEGLVEDLYSMKRGEQPQSQHPGVAAPAPAGEPATAKARRPGKKPRPSSKAKTA